MIEYYELPPNAELASYIKTYWHFHKKVDEPMTYNIMPDGGFDLLIFIKDGRVVDSSLTGIWSKMVTVEYTYTNIVGVRFKPFAVGSLLDLRLREILDASFDFHLNDWHIDGDNILESNFNIYSLAKYFDRCFLAMLRNTNQDRRIQHLFKIIEQMSGMINVENTAREIGLSSRQIHRILNENIGLGLKEYSNIVRFSDSLKMLEKQGTYPLGYYDQSHFIKEFKKYTGLCPRDVDFKNDERYAFFLA